MPVADSKLFFTRDRNSDEIAAGYMFVGEHTYGKLRVHHWAGRENGVLRIGKYCSIAAGVEVFLGGNHRPDWVALYPFNTLRGRWPAARGITGQPTTRGDVVIGNDVWIGAGATIMSGINIGDGAVIAAKALVTKDVRPFEIVGGNPARHLRFRFEDDVISELSAIAWWDWADERVATFAGLLASTNIREFIDAVSNGSESLKSAIQP